MININILKYLLISTLGLGAIFGGAYTFKNYKRLSHYLKDSSYKKEKLNKIKEESLSEKDFDELLTVD